MASFIAALMGAIPVAGIALAFIPMLIVEMLVFAFPELFNSEILAGLQPDALMEYFKSMF